MGHRSFRRSRINENGGNLRWNLSGFVWRVAGIFFYYISLLDLQCVCQNSYNQPRSQGLFPGLGAPPSQGKGPGNEVELQYLFSFHENFKSSRLKDVRVCYCASLLRTHFTCHVMHRARALSTEMNNRAGGHC